PQPNADSKPHTPRRGLNAPRARLGYRRTREGRARAARTPRGQGSSSTLNRRNDRECALHAANSLARRATPACAARLQLWTFGNDRGRACRAPRCSSTQSGRPRTGSPGFGSEDVRVGTTGLSLVGAWTAGSERDDSFPG